jgi:hypothetical protein
MRKRNALPLMTSPNRCATRTRLRRVRRGVMCRRTQNSRGASWRAINASAKKQGVINISWFSKAYKSKKLREAVPILLPIFIPQAALLARVKDAFHSDAAPVVYAEHTAQGNDPVTALKWAAKELGIPPEQMLEILSRKTSAFGETSISEAQSAIREKGDDQ